MRLEVEDGGETSNRVRVTVWLQSSVSLQGSDTVAVGCHSDVLRCENPREVGRLE